MRKSFTRLFGLFILFCMMTLQVVASAPTVSSLSPYDGQNQVASTRDFVITMNQTVKAVYNGTISLNNQSGTEYIPIQLRSAFETSPGSGVFTSTVAMAGGSTVTWKVTFSGTKVTINFGYNMGEFKNYYITVSESCIQNLSNEKFAGLAANGPGVLTTGNDAPAWDFTTADLTPPTPVWANPTSTNPKDEQVNVSPSLSPFVLQFSEDVKWASGYPAALANNVGDIALYTCTDAGVYGGDVVFPKCSTATIVGNLLYIQWPGTLPSLTKMYVRIKPGIITDLQNLPFAGFNTNGQPYTWNGVPNVGWNFSTKDARVPVVTFAATDACAPNVKAGTNFTIDLDETGIVIAGASRTPISTSNIAPFITFSGGAFSVTGISVTGGHTIITIDPTAALVSGNTYTVGLSAGLWDSGDNAIPAKTSSVFTAGDFIAPTNDIAICRNPDGTSFYINLRVNNEPAGTNTNYYYIVVKADSVKNAAGTNLNFYKPETVQTLYYAAKGLVVAPFTTANTYHYEGSTTISPDNDDRDIYIWQRGQIVAPANTELMEHVVSLPASHGTDWVVYLFGADGSLCSANTITGISPTANITSVFDLRQSTYDILPPTVNFTAAKVDPSDEYDGCSELPGTDTDAIDVANGIRRNGPIYVNFNEAVENADGSAITGNSIASAVTLIDNTTRTYAINTSTSYYDAANKRMVIYPTTAFASGVTLTVTLGANKVQDAVDEVRFGPNGTELLTPQADDFCIESYVGPIVTISPCSGTEVLDRVGDIIIYVDQDLYAPAYDGGGLLSNDTSAVNFVGKYIQVRKHGVYPTDPIGPNTPTLRDAGSIIYHGQNPAYSYFLNQVNITVTYPTSGDADSTIIKISPKDPTSDFWESETWYSVELEENLHSVDGLDLSDVDNTLWKACTEENYWGYFRAEDSRSPLCIFYEDKTVHFANSGLGTGDPVLDGNLTVLDTSNILVSIDEWVKLGFDGFKDLKVSDRIDDANALRRYFALFEVNGSTLTPISFDCKYFTLDKATDIAQFYIDPYYPGRENPNWTKGKNYRVCFIDNPNEFAQYVNLPALTDDNLNGVATACANFRCPTDPVPPTCLVSATLNGAALYTSGTSVTNVAITSDSIVTMQLCFDVPVDQPLGGTVSIMRGIYSVQTANMNAGVRSTDYKCITYTFNMHGTEWEENTNYQIIFSDDSLISHAPVCYFPRNTTDPFNDVHTIDGSAPYITGFIPDLIGAVGSNPRCLRDKDSTDIIIYWNEAVSEQTGKKLEIWRASTNSLIAQIDASYDTTKAGDTYMRIPNSLFSGLLEYNQSYYIHISKGFVKNNVGLENAQITTNDTLRFCVGPDPAPRIYCTPDPIHPNYKPFDPADGSMTPLIMPTLTVSFSEAVTPVSGKYIQVYEGGETTNYLSFATSAMTMVSGSGGKQWRISTASLFSLPGAIHPEGFEQGSCYQVNIDAGAFKEASGTQVSNAIITNTVGGTLTATSCTWTFCIGDNISPTVSFWPVNNQQHVATNSFLYAYISELPFIDDGNPATALIPLNVTNVKQFFNLVRGTLNTPVPFDVEFVGNDIPGGDNQKQRIRVVPRDPLGPDWSLTSATPSMMADSIYTLIFNNTAGSLDLEDAAGNFVTNNSTRFHIEDIMCPLFDYNPLADAAVTKATADSIYVTTSINEGGTIRWVVVNNNAAAPAASAVWGTGFEGLGIARGEKSTTNASAPAYNLNFAFKFDATQATGYNFDVYIYAKDDEVDVFDTDAKILAEWPYSDPVKGFETETYRIKDLRPSPNWCNSSSRKLDVQFCDNDAPILVKAIPTNLGVSDPGRVMQWPVEQPITLIFNEDIQINDNNLTGTKIVLRDAHNNLGVPLAYRVFGGDTLILYPLDSAQITNEAQSFQVYTGSNPFKNLAEERDYYLEIDRFAISDVNGCNGNNNSFGEWIGKEKLAFRTEDNTGPCLISWTPSPTWSDPYCIDPEADIQLKFTEINTPMVNLHMANPDSQFVYIYKVGSIVPHERIPASSIIGPVAVPNHPDQWTFTVPTTYLFLSKATYQVRIPAGLFIDNSGNVQSCYNGFSWTFSVRDYEDPIASWTTIQDFTYLNVAYTDPEYMGKIVSGAAGATVNDVPTSSLLKVEFNEEVYIRDSENHNAWTRMDLMSGTNSKKAQIAAAITLKETTQGGTTTTLTYDSDGYGNSTNVGNWEFTEIGSDYVVMRVYRASEHYTNPLSQPWLKDAGLKSNATYTIAVAGNKFADDEDCDNTRNIYDGNNPLVTINTRDDVPPTLAITDAANNAVCGALCVEAASPIKLHFSSKVVKTPFAGIDYDATNPASWPSTDVNWWTDSNLPLSPADLMSTSHGDFLTFYRTDQAGTAVYDSVRLSNVIVDANGMDITLELSSPLVSQGWYKIKFAGGSVKDQRRAPASDGNEFVGLDCKFRVRDTQAPYATGFYLADNAADQSTVLNGGTTLVNAFGTSSIGKDSLAIMFSEPIKKSASTDNLIIRRLNGQIFDEVAVSKCNIDNTNKSVLVIPVKPLEEFTSYYVEVPAGYVIDTTGCTPNGNVGIDPEIPYSPSNRFAWNFSTADATPPVAITFIPNDTDTVPRNSNLSIIFDENVYAAYTNCSTAYVNIYRQDNFGQSGGWVGNPTVDFGNLVESIPFWSTPTIPNYALEGTDIYNGLTQDKIVFNPVNDFSRVGTYYVRLTGGCIKDGQGNSWEGLGDSTTWKFTVTNDVAPVLAATTPAYNHATAPWQYVELPADDHGYVIADLSMRFVDAANGQPLMVTPGSGKFKIMEYRYNPSTFSMEEKLWKSIDVNDASVVFNNDVVTINDVLLRDNINKSFGNYKECYYVLADPGTVTNGYPGSQTFWAGINNAFVWRFQTGADDVFVAGYDILSPNLVDNGDDAKNLTIAAASKLEVTFNEGIEALVAPAGRVQVFKTGVSTPVESIVVTQAMISGKKLTVPLTNLVDETNYNVVVQAGAFGDTSTVSTPNFVFGGVGVWEFQTGDNTAPVAITKAPQGGCVGSSANLTMTFNESRGVVKGSGNLEVVNGAGTVVAQVAASAIVISADGNTVTAAVTGLPDTTALTVNVPAGFIFDGDTHSPLPNAAFSWNFTTGENTAPRVVSITPDAPTTADVQIEITFSEAVNPVAGKSVMINDVAVPVADFTTTDKKVYTLDYTVVSEKAYSVVVAAGTFEDVNAGCTPNGVIAKTEEFTVGDLTAPEVVGSTTPSEPKDYKGLVLNLSFTDAVTPATGNVVIYKANGTVVETIAASAFTAGTGNTVYTYAPKNVRYGNYYVLIDSAAFVDNTAAPAGKNCAGISDPNEFKFSVIDNEFVDCYHIVSPLRATTNVALTTKVVINFCDERIAPGVGSITIADQNVQQVENVNFFYYPVTTSMINGNTLTIDATGLKENTTYSIIIPYGAITDEAGNPFIGITDANLWIFTTGDFTNPTVTVAAQTVLNDGTAAPVEITSSEAGTVYLAKDDVAANATALLAAIADKKAVAEILVAPGVAKVDVKGLVPGNYKAYAFDASGRMGTATNIVVVTAPVLPTLYKISEIQGTGETSPLIAAGKEIRTKGTVTAVTSAGYYIQDANAVRSGIFVASTQVVEVGSSVEITGKPAEVGGITVMNNISKTEFIAPVIKVEPIAAASITEDYESVLVKVEGRATAAATVTGDWTIGTYTINNALYGSYTTLKDYKYQVNGIGAGTKVLAIEIINVSQNTGVNDLSSTVKVYPNPFTNYITLNVTGNTVITKAVITNMAGQLVKEVINPTNTIQTSELRNGVYFISLHTENGIAKTERIIKR